jgi:hypothetical protein
MPPAALTLERESGIHRVVSIRRSGQGNAKEVCGAEGRAVLHKDGNHGWTRNTTTGAMNCNDLRRSRRKPVLTAGFATMKSTFDAGWPRRG